VGGVVSAQASFNRQKLLADFTGTTDPRECASFSAMGPRSKQPVVICPRCRRRMATKEHKPVGPKQRKAIKFSDSLVEVAYVCESCGTEIKRTIREK
jgi:DNA-directed RNA polymerase subunit RPC12/RpoP